MVTSYPFKNQACRIGLIFLGISALIFFGCSPYPSNSQSEAIREHIFSHRGASGEEMEHTFAAYDLALAYGSQYIEIDLVTSKDGTLYISHDETAERITGDKRAYIDMDDNQINQLYVQKGGEPIHSLNSVLERYGNTTHYLIEIRSASQVDLLLDSIIEYEISEIVIVQAKSVAILAQVRDRFPEMHTLLIVEDDDLFLEGIESSYVDILALYKKMITTEYIEQAHDAGKQINAWTLNTTEEIKTMIDLGVDSYFTDYTAKAFVIEMELL